MATTTCVRERERNTATHIQFIIIADAGGKEVFLMSDKCALQMGRITVSLIPFHLSFLDVVVAGVAAGPCVLVCRRCAMNAEWRAEAHAVKQRPKEPAASVK